ncbi:MAG: Rid family detoxifying hydrolase [Planctomycetota bacterium]|jgi:2-iminobutanoate/2-iminopropanoate deaminase|nr:Rid family detoxifying hydrolase [Planctomycetota bacterium]
MSELRKIETDKAPLAVGAYSQAIRIGDLVFTSGNLPIDPVNKTMPEDVKTQAKTALANVKAVLEAAGSGMDRVVKSTVFLADIKDFQAVNEVYAAFFSPPYPARSCFAVAALPLGAKLEIEVVALAT